MWRWGSGVLRGLLTLIAIALIGCAAPSPPSPSVVPTATGPTPQHIWIGVEEGARPLADFISANYEREGIVLHLVAGSGRILLDDLQQDLLDAVFIYRIPPGADVWHNPVAIDGVVFVVHPDNPVTNLASADVRAIFSGQQRQWPNETRANGEDIAVYVRNTGDSGRALMDERIMGAQRVDITAETMASDDALRAAIAADPQGIGYTMMGIVDDAVAVTSLDGRAAIPNTVGTQQYLLTTPIYAATLEEPRGIVQDVIGWLQAPETQAELGVMYGRVR